MNKTVKITLIGTLAVGTTVGATLPAISCSGQSVSRNVTIKNSDDAATKLKDGSKLIENRFSQRDTISDQKNGYEYFNNHTIKPTDEIFKAFAGIKTFEENNIELEWDKVVHSMTSYTESSFPTIGGEIIPKISIKINLKDGIKTIDDSQLDFDVIYSSAWKSSNTLKIFSEDESRITNGFASLKREMELKDYKSQRESYNEWLNNDEKNELNNKFKGFITFTGYDWDQVVEGFDVTTINDDDDDKFPIRGGESIPGIKLTIKFKNGFVVSEENQDKLSIEIEDFGIAAANNVITIKENTSNFNLFKIDFRKLFENKRITEQKEVYEKLIDSNKLPTEELLNLFKSSVIISDSIEYDDFVSRLEITNNPWIHDTNEEINNFNIKIIPNESFAPIEGNEPDSNKLNFKIDHMGNTASAWWIELTIDPTKADLFKSELKELFVGKSLAEQKEMFIDIVNNNILLNDELYKSFKDIFTIKNTENDIDLTYDDVVLNLTIDSSRDTNKEWLPEQDIGDLNIKLNLKNDYRSNDATVIGIDTLGRTPSTINIRINIIDDKKDKFITKVENKFKDKNLIYQKEAYINLMNHDNWSQDLKSSFEKIFEIKSDDVTNITYDQIFKSLTITSTRDENIEWQKDQEIGNITIELKIKDIYINTSNLSIDNSLKIEIDNLGQVNEMPIFDLKSDKDKKDIFEEQVERYVYAINTLKDQRNAYNRLINADQLPFELRKWFEDIFKTNNSIEDKYITYDKIVKDVKITNSTPWEDKLNRKIGIFEITIETNEGYTLQSKDKVIATKDETWQSISYYTIKRTGYTTELENEFKEDVRTSFSTLSYSEQKKEYEDSLSKNTIPFNLESNFKEIFKFYHDDYEVGYNNPIDFDDVKKEIIITGDQFPSDSTGNIPNMIITIELKEQYRFIRGISDKIVITIDNLGPVNTRNNSFNNIDEIISNELFKKKF